jgi:hypothetical protein
MERVDDLRWRKESFSGNGGASCVEVGQARDGMILVRDTKNRGREPVHRYTPENGERSSRACAPASSISMAPAACREPTDAACFLRFGILPDTGVIGLLARGTTIFQVVT